MFAREREEEEEEEKEKKRCMDSLICWPLTRWKWSVVTVNRCVRFDPTHSFQKAAA